MAGADYLTVAALTPLLRETQPMTCPDRERDTRVVPCTVRQRNYGLSTIS